MDTYDALIEKPKVTIGDISFFQPGDLQALLTFLETNPTVDCYSSLDVKSPVILSRFTKVIKEELPQPYPSEESKNRSYKELYDNQLHDRYSILIAKTPLNKV